MQKKNNDAYSDIFGDENFDFDLAFESIKNEVYGWDTPEELPRREGKRQPVKSREDEVPTPRPRKKKPVEASVEEEVPRQPKPRKPKPEGAKKPAGEGRPRPKGEAAAKPRKPRAEGGEKVRKPRVEPVIKPVELQPEMHIPAEPLGKKKKSRRVLRRVLIGVAVFLLLIAVGVALVFNHFYGLMNIDSGKKDTPSTPTPAPVTEQTPEPTATPEPTPEPTATPVPLTEEELLELELREEAAELVYDENVYNILLMGTDNRNDATDSRTDAMFVLTINKATKELWITSLQRDTWIDIPGWGSAKLNAANVYGGIDLLIDTIETGLGIRIDNYITVNIMEAIEIADMLGGITVTLTADEVYYMNLAIIENNHMLQAYDSSVDSNDQIIWDLKDGTYQLNGKQTIGYCRIRALDGTTARSARQRDALTQLWGNVQKMSLMEIYKIVEKGLSVITTDMSRGQCASLMLTLPSLLDYEIESHQIPVKGAYFSTMINGQSAYRVDYTVNRAYIRSTIYGQQIPDNELVSYITGNYAFVGYNRG